MRIWTQNLLAVIPVFIALALALGLVFYSLERSNLIQGARDEAAAQALTISEFDAQQQADHVTDPAGSAAMPGGPPARLLRPLKGILRYGPARQIVELTPDARRIVWSYPEPPSSTPANDLANAPTVPMRLAKSETYVYGPTPSARGPVIRAYSRSLLGDAPSNPIIGVEISAADVTGALDATLRLILRIAGGILGLGIAVVLLTSLLITREVRTLSAAAAQVTAGDLDVEARPGRIQEIGDLGNTFNTMSAVLRDVLAKTRRSLIEGEQFRSDTDLAHTYANLYRPALDTTVAGVRFVGGAVGDDGLGAVWLVTETPSGPCAIIGHVAEIEPLEAAVAASAATRMLRDLLPTKGVEGALADTAALFTFSDLRCLLVERSASGQVESLRTCRCSSGQPEMDSQSAPGALPQALHTLGVDADPIIDQYLRLFVDLPVDELRRDLIPALPAGARGILILAGNPAHE